jgi:hypothetical protein
VDTASTLVQYLQVSFNGEATRVASFSSVKSTAFCFLALNDESVLSIHGMIPKS